MIVEKEEDDEDAEADMLETAAHIEQVLALVKTGARPPEEDDDEAGTTADEKDVETFQVIYTAYFGERWEP